MMLPCEMIQDLLPLYHDDVCSDASKTLVQEHLANCENCREYLASLDIELDVPTLEMEKADPLVKIQMNWTKQSKRERIKYISSGVAAFLVLVTLWWGLTQWCIVPLKANDYIIKEAAQLESGIIHIEFSVMYDKAEPETGITDDGILFENYRRPILAVRRNQIPNGSAGVYLDPANLSWPDLGNFIAYCLGNPKSEESILVWEQGMIMPAASQKSEDEFHQIKDAYTAPNAPEEPDVISIVKLEPTQESTWKDSDNVCETVVCGSDVEN